MTTNSTEGKSENLPVKVRVESCVSANPRVNIYALAAFSGINLPPYAPGAHIRVTVTAANGLKELRSYSLIDPYDTAKPYRIAVQREIEGKGGSLYFHGNVHEGSEIEILPPSNHFPLDPDAKHSVLIAGGIGITPIFCMAKHLCQQGKSFELHYAGRSLADMALLTEVTSELGQHSTLYTDDAGATGKMDCQLVLARYKSGDHVYVCGPAGLIQAVRDSARVQGWPQDAVHFELFSNPLASDPDDSEITVELRQTGITLLVKGGNSILDAVIAAGVDCDYDCRAGECGACLTEVLEGSPLHRDFYLNEKEKQKGDSICTCVSWSNSKLLVLDL